MLTPEYTFQSDTTRRLFDNLILGEEDIKDKSKADWVLKGLAIAQVSWLILSVIVRSILHLPITQLEIATISFAVMAILSYMVNWWKPKDISRATFLPLPADGYCHWIDGSNQQVGYPQSFMSRLWSPTKAHEDARVIDDQLLRVPNDFVWMKGESPLLFILMAFSSLGFGSLHCLAWNFEFPSTAELFCWRVASIISTALPTVTLGISLLLHFLATNYTDFWFVSTLLSKLKPMDGLKPEIWKSITNPPWGQWGGDAKLFLARTPTESRNWDEEPSAETIQKHRSSKPKQFRFPAWCFGSSLGAFSDIWQLARDTTPYAARGLYKEWIKVGEEMVTTSKEEVDVWQDYETHIKRKHGIHVPETPDHGCIAFILRAFNETMEEGLWWNKFRGFLNKASLILTIVNGVIYTVARLAILVLLFTCLRETPADVYRVTPWVNFLPNIS